MTRQDTRALSGPPAAQRRYWTGSRWRPGHLQRAVFAARLPAGPLRSNSMPTSPAPSRCPTASLAALLCGVALLVSPPTGSAPAPAVDWPVYGGDAGSMHYSALADINVANVGSLELAWTWKTGEGPLPEHGTTPGIFEATPLVVDCVMYLSTPYNRVVALDPVSGRELWSYDPRAYDDGQVPNGMGFVHRGIAAWRDVRTHALRILINSRYRLIELDARTGTPVEAFGRHGVVDIATVDILRQAIIEAIGRNPIGPLGKERNSVDLEMQRHGRRLGHGSKRPQADALGRAVQKFVVFFQFDLDPIERLAAHARRPP